MAFLFNDATPDYLSRGASAFNTYPFTLAARVRFDALPAIPQTVVCASKQSGGAARHARIGADASGNAFLQSVGAGTNILITGGALSTGVWYQLVGKFIDNDFALWVDGTESVDTNSGPTITDINGQSIGALLTASASAAVSGDIAEVAYWNVGLTDAEIGVLIDGGSALAVRPESLDAYVPLVRTTTDLINGAAWTTNGAPTASNHPRIYRPRYRRRFVPAPPAGGVVRSFTVNADGVGAATVDEDTVFAVGATAAGVGATTVSMAVVRGLGGVQADGAATTTAIRHVWRPLTAQADGVGAVASDVQIIKSVGATATGAGATTVSLAVVRGLGTVTAAGTGTAASDLQAIYPLTATVAGSGDSSISSIVREPGVVNTLSATAAGVGAAATPDVFRRIIVASEGALNSGANVVALLSTDPPSEHVATVAGVGTAAVTLYRIVNLGISGDPAGTSTVTAILFADEYNLAATADGVGTASVSLAVVRELGNVQADGAGATTAIRHVWRPLTAQADGVGATAVNVDVVRGLGNITAVGVGATTVAVVVVSGGGTTYELTAQADGAGAATTSSGTVRALTAAADGTAAVTLAIQPQDDVVATVTGAGGVTLDMAVVRSVVAMADGTTVITLDVAAVSSVAAGADGAGTATTIVTIVLGTPVASGKYAPEHALAYEMVKEAEESGYSGDAAAAFADIFNAGV